MQRKCLVEPTTARDVIKEALNLRTQDSIRDSDRMNRDIAPTRGMVVSYGQPDSRRNANPLDFQGKSQWCFADETASSCWGPGVASARYFEYSTLSGVFLPKNGGKALQYARQCVPEPTVEHIADMLEIASLLGDKALTIMNLPGTGASVPQNFHTQIVPLVYWWNHQPQPDTVAKQLSSIRTFGQPHHLRNNIVISHVTLPVFGLVIDFSRFSDDPEEIGKKLFAAIHKAVRYGSQLQLGYNLYIQGGNVEAQETSCDRAIPPGSPPDWRRITVLFRKTLMERVCATQEMYQLVQNRVGAAKAEQIRCSDNRHWRWGWWEMIGGLFARDDSFADDRFDEEFWGDVYDLLTIKDRHRFKILEQVERELV